VDKFISSVGGLTDDGTIVLAELFQHKYESRKLNLFGYTSNVGVLSLAKALYHNDSYTEN
jgi:hypothetical protein